MTTQGPEVTGDTPGPSEAPAPAPSGAGDLSAEVALLREALAAEYYHHHLPIGEGDLTAAACERRYRLSQEDGDTW